MTNPCASDIFCLPTINPYSPLTYPTYTLAGLQFLPSWSGESPRRSSHRRSSSYPVNLARLHQDEPPAAAQVVQLVEIVQRRPRAGSIQEETLAAGSSPKAWPSSCAVERLVDQSSRQQQQQHVAQSIELADVIKVDYSETRVAVETLAEDGGVSPGWWSVIFWLVRGLGGFRGL